jgi:hypothetical protein
MIEAQEQLKQIQIADWPNMKKSSREKIHRDLHKKAFPTKMKKSISVDDFKRILGGAGG